MSDATFFRVLDPDPEEKGTQLARQVAQYCVDGGDGSNDVFAVKTEEFSAVPESPFAYWVDDSARKLFKEHPSLGNQVTGVQVGASTKNDFRYLRLWWEVEPRAIGYSLEESTQGKRWIHFAKGGAYSPYFADVHLLVNWNDDGAEVEADVLQKYSYLKGNAEWVLHRSNDYFKPGLTWPRRTQRGLNLRAYPAGSIFADKGPAIFVDEKARLPCLLGIGNSALFRALVEAQMAFGSYEVGVLQRTPLPESVPSGDPWGVFELVHLARRPATRDEVTHDFRVPSLCLNPDLSIADAGEHLDDEARDRMQNLVEGANRVEEHVQALYGFDQADKVATESAVATLQPDVADEDEEQVLEDQARRVANLLMWCVGVAFGRWDVRMAKNQSLIPDLQGPFERLPRVAPGGLVGPDGLPATVDRIASEAWLRVRPDAITLPDPEEIAGDARITADEYPVDVAWDGVLVDDPGHPRDIVGKVREVLRYVYGAGRAEAIEEEALEILRADGRTPGSLRDWLRNRTATELGRNFFDFHVRRYSKSRRKAPIYWRLCSNPGRGQSQYAVWLYYHRLTDDTLWTVLNSYLGPKLERVEQRAEKLRSEIETTEGSESRRFEKEREEGLELLEELRWFEGELRKVAESGWKPERDDGVVINLAPFHKVMRWNEPEKHWKRLQKGEYDWSLTAMRYWPDRVREKCRTDRSLAIAHGLEELYEGD